MDVCTVGGDHPAPQSEVLTLNIGEAYALFLVILMIVFALGILVNLARDNERSLPWYFSRIVFLDTKACVTGFIAAFSLLATKYSVDLTYAPNLSYTTRVMESADLSYLEKTKGPAWQVRIGNTGNGPAIISAVRYCIRLDNGTLKEFSRAADTKDYLSSVSSNDDNLSLIHI